jgi:hypothetical protein
MSSIQSLLAIGSIALFSLISVRFNSSVLQNLTLEVENKVYLTAFSLADDMIEEIKQKAFDHETVQFRSINPEELSPTANFGGGKIPVKLQTTLQPGMILMITTVITNRFRFLTQKAIMYQLQLTMYCQIIRILSAVSRLFLKEYKLQLQVITCQIRLYCHLFSPYILKWFNYEYTIRHFRFINNRRNDSPDGVKTEYLCI